MAVLTDIEELRFLRFRGLLRESVKVILSHSKLFVALTLTLILPLSVVGLGHLLISEPIKTRIMAQLAAFRRHRNASTKQRSHQDLATEYNEFILVFVVYIPCLLALSLLATAAMVYSVACIYSEKVTSYKKVLSVVPCVWKRLTVTFLWAALIVVVYTVVCRFVRFVTLYNFPWISQGSDIVANLVTWGGAVGFFAGRFYLSCVWHLASVVTVLEDGYGFEAMEKSLKLIKGRQWLALVLFSWHFLTTSVIEWGFERWVMHSMRDMPSRMFLGCALILMNSFVDLWGFVVQTVFYFACKASHNESIDRLQLSEHLGADMGVNLPLQGSIQLEAFEV